MHSTGQGSSGGLHSSTQAKGLQKPPPCQWQCGQANSACAGSVLGCFGQPGQLEDGLCWVPIAVLGVSCIYPLVLSRPEGLGFGCSVMSSCSVMAVGGEGGQGEGKLIPKPAQLVHSLV